MVTRLAATITTLILAAACLVGGAGDVRAQLQLPPLAPTTTTTVPGATPPSTPPTTADVVTKLLAPPTTTAPTTGPTTTAKPGGPVSSVRPDNLGGEGEAPPADAGPFPADLAAQMNSVRRTGPGNSYALVDALKALTDLGVPLDEAMRVGMGRFPVAGRANYSHDWWFPRFGPGWRLHQGTDIFAERGTPLRSPTTGTVRFSDGGLGGISVYITQADGTYFYLTHLESRPEGLKEGQTVNVGDIVGFNGSSGNAAGGSPHLHFEVHPAIKFVTVGKGKKRTTKAVSAPVRPGTVLPAIDPKPLLDLYRAEALEALPGIVATYQANGATAVAVSTGPAIPVAAAAIAGQHLAVGGLIAAEAPLVRTPLLLLAFLLIVMVLVLMPVLTSRQRLVAGASPGRHAAEKRNRKRPGRASRPPPAAVVTASVAPGASPPETKRLRVRRRKSPEKVMAGAVPVSDATPSR